MQKDTYEKIIGFLLGASWAIVFFGALLTFQLFLSLGIFFALFSTTVFIIIALFLILALDSFNVNKRRLEESIKQTKLLENIEKKLEG